MTVGNRSYYVYRYEGSLNGIENAVVLISYPKGAFHVPKVLRAFVSKDVSLDRYQTRSSQEISRYGLLMSLAHLLAYISCGETMSFELGYTYIYSHIQEELLRFIYQCGARYIFFEDSFGGVKLLRIF